MDKKFTKGKWVINNDELPKELIVYSNFNERRICTVYDKTDRTFNDIDEAHYNAQLIAHAPEMLEMLDKMRKAILSEDFTRMLCESQSAKELITKATTI